MSRSPWTVLTRVGTAMGAAIVVATEQFDFVCYFYLLHFCWFFHALSKKVIAPIDFVCYCYLLNFSWFFSVHCQRKKLLPFVYTV